jgi:hypothetical protein
MQRDVLKMDDTAVSHFAACETHRENISLTTFSQPRLNAIPHAMPTPSDSTVHVINIDASPASKSSIDLH